jgi:hypothetical protein
MNIGQKQFTRLEYIAHIKMHNKIIFKSIYEYNDFIQLPPKIEEEEEELDYFQYDIKCIPHIIVKDYINEFWI